MCFLRIVYALLCSIVSYNLVAASDITGDLPIAIKDARTELPITSARVCIGADSLCATTDTSGSITFTGLTPGRYVINITAEGYAVAVERNVLVHKGLNYRLIIALDKATVVELDKMTVTAIKRVREKPSQSTSTTHVTSFELTNTPGTADDICRVIATNPAVVSTGSGIEDNTMYVRGGNSNENVYIIDGLELDNANHFSNVDQSGGGISFLAGSLVRELDFYTGGFPAAFPARLSAVIDMQLRTGSFTDYKVEVDANIAGLGFTCEGPVTRKLSFLTSVRMVDLRGLDQYLDFEGLPRFGDAMLKLVYTPDAHHTFRALSLGAVDNYHEKYDTSDYSFPTSYDEWIYQGGGMMDWTWRTERMRNIVSVAGSARKEKAHDDALHTGDAMAQDTFKANWTEFRRSGTIIDSLLLPTDTMFVRTYNYTGGRLWEDTDLRWRATVKDQLTLFLRDNDQFGVGCTFSTNRYWVRNMRAYTEQTMGVYTVDGERVIDPEHSWDAYTVDSVIDVRHIGGYVEYVLNEGWLKMVAGLRGDYYTVLTDYGLSPRMGAQLRIPSLGTFSLSGGLYYQFPSDFNGMIADIITTNPNYYESVDVPLDEARLQRNWQGVFRYERQLDDNHELTFETYYKWYDREYPFESPNNHRYNEYSDGVLHWLLDKANGKKRAYGAEVVLKSNRFEHLYYICSYSLFKVENRYVDGKWYLDENSLGNMLGLTIGGNFARNHGLSLRIAAAKGKRYSRIQENAMGDGFEYDTARGYFREQLDPMVSGSFRYSFTHNRSWGNLTGYLEIWNLFNYTPVIQRYFGWSGYRDFRPNGILPLAGVKVTL